MNFTPVALSLSMIFPTAAMAWELSTKTEDDGRVFTIAEQIGDAGSFLNLVCFEREIYIEVIYPTALEAADDAVELFQVDGRSEHLVAGFIENIDRSTSVFVGIDRRDKPSMATPQIISEISAGNSLYLGDPDSSEAVERWSLNGSSRVIQSLVSSCR